MRCLLISVVLLGIICAGCKSQSVPTYNPNDVYRVASINDFKVGNAIYWFNTEWANNTFYEATYICKTKLAPGFSGPQSLWCLEKYKNGSKDWSDITQLDIGQLPSGIRAYVLATPTK